MPLYAPSRPTWTQGRVNRYNHGRRAAKQWAEIDLPISDLAAHDASPRWEFVLDGLRFIARRHGLKEDQWWDARCIETVFCFSGRRADRVIMAALKRIHGRH